MGDQGGERVLDGQLGPHLLDGQVRQPGAQDPAGAAQVSSELVVGGLLLPSFVVAGGDLIGPGVMGVEDGGEYDDQFAGAVAGPVGDVVLDDPGQVRLVRV